MGPLVRNFTRGGTLSLSVSASNHRYFNITSLAWYHNGVEIISGENKQAFIDRSGTRLLINNLKRSDAGKYQVKIKSTSFNLRKNFASCDATTLPILESLSVHAPVTFTVQEKRTPTYNPSNIISTTFYITKGVHRVFLLRTAIDPSLDIEYSHFTILWSKNGSVSFRRRSTSDRVSSSLQLQSSTSSSFDIFGDYIGAFSAVVNNFDQYFTDLCRGYSDYLANTYLIVPLAVSYWSVKLYSK